jgi:HSP20 family protein
MAKEKGKRDETTPAVAAREPFGELWRPFGGRVQRLFREMEDEWPGFGARGWLPALDVNEDDGRYVVTVELPGAKREDVNVELQEGLITIHGEKKSEREEKKEKQRYVERRFGSFSRSFSLPRDADADHVEASFKDGVLTLTIPKTEQTKAKTVAIK